jgi:hypothetical protein
MCGDPLCFSCGRAQGTFPDVEEITVDDLEEYYADFLTAMDKADAALDDLKAAIAVFLRVEAPPGA